MAQKEENTGLIQMLLRDGKLPSVEVELATMSMFKLGAALAVAGMLIVTLWFIYRKALKNG